MNSEIEILAGRLRAANLFGRSEALRKLFDFLVAHANDSQAPRELEVAEAIFGASADFDSTQDASVRVYIHRLRQRLDDYYAGSGKGEATRLALPKGIGYRIVVEPLEAQPTAVGQTAATAQEPRRWRLRHWAILGGVVLLFLNVAAWMFFVEAGHRNDEFAAVRANPLWNGSLSDSRSITLVVGDYYILAKTPTTRATTAWCGNTPSILPPIWTPI